MKLLYLGWELTHNFLDIENAFLFQINLYFHLHCCVKLKDVENRKNEQQSIYASQVTEVSKS